MISLFVDNVFINVKSLILYYISEIFKIIISGIKSDNLF